MRSPVPDQLIHVTPALFPTQDMVNAATEAFDIIPR